MALGSVGAALATGIGGALASKAVGSMFGDEDGGAPTRATEMTRSRPEWVERELQNLYGHAQNMSPQAFSPIPLTNTQEAALARIFYGADKLQPELTAHNSTLKKMQGQGFERVGTRANPQKITTRANPQAITTRRFTETMKNGEFDPYREKVFNPAADRYNRQADIQKAQAERALALGGKRNSANANLGLAELERGRNAGLRELEGDFLDRLATIFQSDEARNLLGQQSQADIFKQDILNELAAQEKQADIYNQDIGRELQAALANQNMDYNNKVREQGLVNDIINNVYKQYDMSKQDTNDLLRAGDLQERKQGEYRDAEKNRLNWLQGLLTEHPQTSSTTYGVAPNRTLSDISRGAGIIGGFNELSGGALNKGVGDFFGNLFGGGSKSNANSGYRPLPSFDLGGGSAGSSSGSRYFNPYK